MIKTLAIVVIAIIWCLLLIITKLSSAIHLLKDYVDKLITINTELMEGVDYAQKD